MPSLSISPYCKSGNFHSSKHKFWIYSQDDNFTIRHVHCVKAPFRGRYLFHNNFPIALFIFVIFVRKPFLTDDYEKISNKFDVLTELLAIIRGDSIEIAKFVLYILICKLPSSYWIVQPRDRCIFNHCLQMAISVSYVKTMTDV